MSFSYSETLTTTKDKVRLITGDTLSTDPQLSDEEIGYFLSVEANVDMAASACCYAIAARYTRKADDKAVGDLRLSHRTTAKRYLDLGDKLRNSGSLHQVPTAGGIRVSEQQANESNSALRHNAIRRGMHDYVAAPTAPNTEGS